MTEAREKMGKWLHRNMATGYSPLRWEALEKDQEYFLLIADQILTLEGDNWRIAVVEKDVIADILRGDWLKEVEK